MSKITLENRALSKDNHNDERRGLYTAFNGEFIARVAGLIMMEDYGGGGGGERTIDITASIPKGGDHILYIIKGTLSTVYHEDKWLTEGAIPEQTRLWVRDGGMYRAAATQNTVLLYCGNTPISEEKKERYTPIFNGNFTAKQAKILDMRQDALLGERGEGHYHNYAEFYAVGQGETRFLLEDITDKTREIKIIKPGETLVIPPRTAHIAWAAKGTMLVGFTEEEFISREKNEKAYKIDVSQLLV